MKACAKKKKNKCVEMRFSSQLFFSIHGFSSNNQQNKAEEFLHASQVINIPYSYEERALLSDSA